MKTVKGYYYCDQDEGFRSLLFKICDLKASSVFLCKDQTLPGRCTIMFKDHYNELFEILKEERDEYMDDVCALAQTIKELFGADKINYAIYGDEVTHVHYTLCPKYRGKLGWGGPFVLFPEEKDKITLTDEQYRERMERIGAAVMEKRGIRP
ncbi:MAG: HIT family protein [Clostridium sp.]|nr:HIT family protein [Clostridium sp.]